MQKTDFLLLLLPFFACTQDQKVLQQDYSFLVTDGEVTRLRQRNDTLFELKCYIDQPCQPEPAWHYKILSASKIRDYVILKLEGLDTIQLTTNPYPESRYQVWALRFNNEKEMGYLRLKSGLTRQQLDTFTTDIPSLKEKFFFTFFSSTYLDELAKRKKITTKEEANDILRFANSDRFKPLVDRYAKTNLWDMYASGLSSEILNRACIEKGYNPVGAGMAINALLPR